ncbi:unnamed protein product [Ilex paraguariensis]|uniref:Transcription factor RAX2 n=1 Tax=Ilex paraguariensis TaxID=185542 RepID=A0ABC8RWV7_9AQUA
MGRAPCCDKDNVKRGPWSPEEDAKLKEFIEKNGTGGNWIALPQKAGLKRCGKSCRLRWLNYLRPNIRHGEFSEEEDRIICSFYASIGSRWSIIAAQLPGRTDNDIKNYWNTKLKKKLMAMAAPSNQRRPPPPFQTPLQTIPSLSCPAQLYRECTSYYTYTPTKSDLTGLEPTRSIPPNLWNNNNNSSLETNYSFVQAQESLVYDPMNYYPVKESHNLLMFGGTEPSCSSSDGSCSQISYGKEIKQEEIGGLQIYLSNGFEENQKFMLDCGSNNGVGDLSWTDQKPNDQYFGNTQSGYGLEEVKQLISSSNGCNYSSFFFNGENKTQERAMYYY